MGIANITYGAIVTDLVNYIERECYNLSTSGKYSQLPAYISNASWNQTEYSAADGNSTYRGNCTVYISSGSVSQITAIVNNRHIVRTALENYLGNKYNLNANITMPEFIGFFNNLVNFCSSHLCYSSSKYTSRRYLIYKEMTSSAPYSGKDDSLVYLSSVVEILNVLKEKINQTVRSVPVVYYYKLT